MAIGVESMNDFIKRQCELFQTELRAINGGDEKFSRRFNAQIYEACTEIIHHKGNRMAFLQYKISDEEQCMRQWSEENATFVREDKNEIFRFSIWVSIGARIADILQGMKERFR